MRVLLWPLLVEEKCTVGEEDLEVGISVRWEEEEEREEVEEREEGEEGEEREDKCGGEERSLWGL